MVSITSHPHIGISGIFLHSLILHTLKAFEKLTILSLLLTDTFISLLYIDGAG